MSLPHALLSILARGPAHGYDLRRAFESSLAGEWEISYGQLYPSLARLTSAGHVTKTPELGVKERERNVYTITDSGRQHLADWMIKSLDCQVRVKDDLSLRLLGFKSLTKKDQRDILKRYLGQTEERLKSLRLGEDIVEDPFLVAIISRGIAHCKAERDWCEKLIDSL